jgi:hypothetical protein
LIKEKKIFKAFLFSLNFLKKKIIFFSKIYLKNSLIISLSYVFQIKYLNYLILKSKINQKLVVFILEFKIVKYILMIYLKINIK